MSCNRNTAGTLINGNRLRLRCRCSHNSMNLHMVVNRHGSSAYLLREGALSSHLLKLNVVFAVRLDISHLLKTCCWAQILAKLCHPSNPIQNDILSSAFETCSEIRFRGKLRRSSLDSVMC